MKYRVEHYLISNFSLKMLLRRISFIRLHHKRSNLGKPLLLCLSGQFFYLQQTESKGGCKCYAKFKQCLGNFFIIFILPLLHSGQQVMSLPVNRSIISRIVSFIFSGNFASGSINFLRSGIACCLFLCARNPKYRIFIKPFGSTCRRKRRMNSSASRVMLLISFSLSLSR